MDVTTPLTVVGGAAVVLIIILTGLCLNCKGSNQRMCIQQTYEGRNSFPSTQGFTIVRPYANNSSFTTLLAHSPQHQQLITTSVTDPRAVSPCPSSDGVSQCDYINQADDDGSSYEQPPEKSNECPDYIDVLPDDKNAPVLNAASSVNSCESYENISQKDNDLGKDSDSQNYVNIGDEMPIQSHVGSMCSNNSDCHGSSDYVNAPSQVHTFISMDY